MTKPVLLLFTLSFCAQINAYPETHTPDRLLLDATSDGNINALEKALERGADINAKDFIGQTALHIAVREEFNSYKKNHPEYITKHDNYLHVMSILLKKPKLKINITDNFGRTSLHWAAYCNNVDAVTQLVKNPKIRLNIKDVAGDTPLHLAASLNHVDCIRELSIGGADKKIKNKNGKTPTDLLAYNQLKNFIIKNDDQRSSSSFSERFIKRLSSWLRKSAQVEPE